MISKTHVLLLLSCLTVMGCLPNSDSEADSNAPVSDYVLVQIADRNFKIHKGYFDGGPHSGRDTESIVIEYSLPGFEILPAHPQFRAERQQLINEGRMKGMLLENKNNKPPFDPVVKSHMSRADFKKEDELVFGLEKFVHQVPEPASPEHIYAPYVQDDFFIERNKDGSVKSYLRCSPPGKDKIPGCRHRFIDNGLLYNIRWRIQELPNWDKQRDADIAFIESNEININKGN